MKNVQLAIARWKFGYKQLSKRALMSAYRQRTRLAKAGAALTVLGILGNLVALPVINNSFAAAPRLSSPNADGTKIYQIWDGAKWLPLDATAGNQVEKNPGLTLQPGQAYDFKIRIANKTGGDNELVKPHVAINLGTAAEKTITTTTEITTDTHKQSGLEPDVDTLELNVAAAQGKKYALKLNGSTFTQVYGIADAGSSTEKSRTTIDNPVRLLKENGGYNPADVLKGGEWYVIMFKATVEPTEEPTPNPNPNPNPTAGDLLDYTLTFDANQKAYEGKANVLKLTGHVKNISNQVAQNVAITNVVDPATGLYNQGSLASVDRARFGIQDAQFQFNTITVGNMAAGDTFTYTYTLTTKNTLKDGDRVYANGAAYVNAQFQDNALAMHIVEKESTAANIALNVNQSIKQFPNGVEGQSVTVIPEESAQVTLRISAPQTNEADAVNVTVANPIIAATPNASAPQGPSNIYVDNVKVADNMTNSGLNIGTMAKGSTKTVTYILKALSSANYAEGNTNYTIINNVRAENVASAVMTPDALNMIVQKSTVATPAMAIEARILDTDNQLKTRVDRKPGEAVQYHVTIRETSNTADLTNLMTKLASGDSRITFHGTQYGPQPVWKGTSTTLVFLANVADANAIATGTHELIARFQATADSNLSAVSNDTQVIVKKDAPQPPAQNYAATFDLQVNNLDYPAGDINENGRVTRTERALPNNRVRYTLTVKNTGDVVLKNAALRDEIPSEMTVDGKKEKETLTWNLGELQIGETKSVTYEGKPVHKKKPYSFDNTAQFIADNVAQLESNKATVSVTAPIFHFTQTVDKTKAKRGEILTYTITIKNTNDTPAKNVEMKHTLAEGLTHKSNDLGQSGANVKDVNSRERLFTWDTINPGEEKMIIVRASINNDVKTRTNLITRAQLNYKDSVGNAYDPLQADVVTEVIADAGTNDGTTNGTTTGDNAKNGTSGTNSGVNADREGRVLGASTTPRTGAGTVALSLMVATLMTGLSVAGYILRKKALALENLKLEYVTFA